MSKPRGKKASGGSSAKTAGGASPTARRLQTAGLFLTLLAVAALVGSMFGGFDWGRAGKGGASPPSAAPRAGGPVPEPPADAIRVEVLNASGRTGLAKQAALHLRDRGFDVVHFGNDPRRRRGDVTLVLDHGSRAGAARQVHDALGAGRVVPERDTTAVVDATVVLGRDWRPEPGPAAAESAGGEAP